MYSTCRWLWRCGKYYENIYFRATKRGRKRSNSFVFAVLKYFVFKFQPPICQNGENLVKRRRKRQTRVIDETQGDLYDTDREDLKVKVYSGLYVNEASDLDDAFLDGGEVPTEIVSIY